MGRNGGRFSESALHAALDQRGPRQIAMDAGKPHQAVFMLEHHVMPCPVVGQDQHVFDRFTRDPLRETQNAVPDADLIIINGDGDALAVGQPRKASHLPVEQRSTGEGGGTLCHCRNDLQEAVPRRDLRV